VVEHPLYYGVIEAGGPVQRNFVLMLRQTAWLFGQVMSFLEFGIELKRPDRSL
jgi:hypothetical protein